MRRFKSAAQLQRFLCAHGPIHDLFRFFDNGRLSWGSRNAGSSHPRIPSEPLREPFEDAYEVMELLICEALNSYKIIYSGFWANPETGRKLLKTMVGAEGFEPPASCSQSRRATKLRHAPTDRPVPLF